MGCPDTVRVPCPTCNEISFFQSKGGQCLLRVFDLANAPADVLSDINRHAPYECARCKSLFRVNDKAVSELVQEGPSW